MKLVFVNRYFHPDHSATSQMLSDLAFALAEQGWPVQVITSRQRYDDPAADLPATETVAGVRIHRVRTPRFGRGRLAGRLLDYLGFYLGAGLALARLADRDTIVVAKTDPPLLSIPAALICRLRGARLVNWLQDLFPEVATALGVRGLQGLFGRLLVRWRNRSLTAAWRNVAIGERMRERLLAEGVDPAAVRVIPNWADGSAVTPQPAEDNPLRRDWGLQDKLVVGYSGNLGRAHEIDTLLDAAERLRDHHDILFLVIGGGALLPALRDAVQARGLDNMQFRPYQPRERLADSLGAADLHLVILRPELEGMIVPSKYYGIAAAGRPALFIGDTDGELARLLHDADCGVAVAPGDGEALARHILELRGSERRHTLGQRARQRFEREYDFPVALRRWEALLRGE